MPSTVRSPASLILGIVFASGTAASLFWDVRSLGDVTLDHVMTGLVLVGTIASGHMFWRQARGLRILPCAGLAILFGGGTFYCVTTSAARNAEVGIPKVLVTLNENEQRNRLLTDIAEAKEDARKSKAVALKDCASGEGAKCKSLTRLATAADSHYWILIGRLATSKPEQPANPGLRHAAQVFAALPGAGSAEAIERSLVLFSPFVKALFLEIATVVFFGIGLGHRSVISTLEITENTKNQSAPVIPVPSVAPVYSVASVVRPRIVEISHKPPFEDLRPPSMDDAATVVNILKTLYRPINNDELAQLMGVTKGEASRRATVALQKGLIVKQRFGKHVAISLKQTMN